MTILKGVLHGYIKLDIQSLLWFGVAFLLIQFLLSLGTQPTIPRIPLLTTGMMPFPMMDMMPFHPMPCMRIILPTDISSRTAVLSCIRMI